jgi:aryl-alcohol dehydrogenase-like predicted oxidoreductase
VRAALEAGITMFDTADTYANGRAETILGDASAAERRESLKVLTKVFGATEPGRPERQRPVPQAHQKRPT